MAAFNLIAEFPDAEFPISEVQTLLALADEAASERADAGVPFLYPDELTGDRDDLNMAPKSFDNRSPSLWAAVEA
ncbi:hypothetical protein [Brevibacterium epidermidis]|uniref:hypothetical protein n=1 Tax=Brevibacterium epidermidis TaxID=1698 RepID=UPI0012FFE70A|nr:hypothetical protein [Brevibacterium epidermidis]